MANRVAADAAHGASVTDARCAGLGNVDDIARGLRIGLSHGSLQFSELWLERLQGCPPVAVRFLPRIKVRRLTLRPEARRYSFALSIFSRTQGAPPRRCSLSRWGCVSLIVTGQLAGAPVTLGFGPRFGGGDGLFSSIDK